jgi:hypothetical protein
VKPFMNWSDTTPAPIVADTLPLLVPVLRADSQELDGESTN